MQTTFPILIHSGFYKLLKESESRFRAKIRKTLQKLESGNWDGGTRVKRLAGVPRPVYEARIDRGDRLMFTAVRAADRLDPGRLITHLQVWDAVHHDAVSRTARRNLVPEAEFLDFETLEHFDIVEPPPSPAAVFNEVSPDGSEPLLHLLIPPENFESSETEGIHGGVRWYQAPPFMLADEAEFQRIMDAGGGELELKLMRDQYEVLAAPGPLLLAGSAGSGKTTIAIHRLVEARIQMETARILYLSYSPWLVDYARRLFHDVMQARGEKRNLQLPDFYTFSDLYRKMIPPSEIDGTRDLVTREVFASWFRKSGTRMDSALVWEELRSILKGACLNLGHAMLGEREYQDLGRKRAPLFVNERPEIYSIAQRYQEWLAEQSRIDQIDLCRRAFRELRHGRARRYDVVVCDEIQDLTELEVGFVLALSKDPALTGVMLAGDTQQIVNPSGFRWAETRTAIARASGARTAPRLARLRRNCRSARPLVDLANAVLELRQEIFGRHEEDAIEDAIAEGPAPIQVLENEKRVLEAIRNFGPRCAILVLDDEESRRLGGLLETTRIFHVRDSKGLEFDTVVLWKLLGAENGLIDRFIRREAHAEKDARLKQFLQLLYVAVTRARRHLAIYEGTASHAFWSDRRFRARLEMESAETLQRLFRESATPEEWAKEGDYYAERTRYRQAAECYRRGGLESKETEALAMFAESVEDWSGALQRWQSAGKLDRQAVLLERLGRIPEAIEMHRRLGQADSVERLETVLLEKQGRWAEAGQRWESAGRETDAARCYQRAGNSARALALEAGIAENNKDWKRAGECWMQLKSYEPAARCFRKSKDKRNAALASALHHESIKDWTKAAAAFKRAGNRRKADECRALALESQGQFLKAARLRERLGDKDRALHLYQKAGDQESVDRFAVERADLRQPQISKVDELKQRGRLQLAIKLARARQAILKKRLSARTWSLSEPPERIQDEFYVLQERIIECSALIAEHAQKWDKAARLWRRIENFPRARSLEEKAIESLRNPITRGIARLKNGQYEKALEAFQASGDPTWIARGQATLCESRKQWKEAADLWQPIDPARQAACMASLARSEDNWSEAARWHRAAGQHALAAEAERMARRKLAAETEKIHREHATLF